MTRDDVPGDATDQFSYWLERYPPGWISGTPARLADPVAIAGDIQTKLVAFEKWLALPDAMRWDNYALQALSAALFNRYRDPRGEYRELAADPPDSELTWPPGTSLIRECLLALRRQLSGPFAVYKAVRSPIHASDFPNRTELRRAETALLANRTLLRNLHERLRSALQSLPSRTRFLNDLSVEPAPRRTGRCYHVAATETSARGPVTP